MFVVEGRGALTRSCDPSGDGVPRLAADPGDCGPVEALDAQVNDFVERCSRVLDSVVGCAGVGGEGLAATRAAVTPSLPSFGLEEAMADDVPFPSLAVILTVYIGALLGL